MQGRSVVRAVGLGEPLGELPGAQPVQRLVHVLLQVLIAADHVVLGDEEVEMSLGWFRVVGSRERE